MDEDIMITTRLTQKANSAIEAYLGWRRGTEGRISKEDAISEAVIFYVNEKLPTPIKKMFNVPSVENQAGK